VGHELGVVSEALKSREGSFVEGAVRDGDTYSIEFVAWEPPSEAEVLLIRGLVEAAELVLNSVVEVALFDPLDSLTWIVDDDPGVSAEQPLNIVVHASAIVDLLLVPQTADRDIVLLVLLTDHL